ncbi:hypothetical protein Acr_01g0012230 [Actinidia rufa]|uniref:Uncharacterized protein n=1 Tax=Actinidia rufa TaxID=165716 RepID=A0A7J0E4J3_9ERIC|nr:hypothetical protein Acr_01g0012230 [Actinidia rufa]
MLMGLLVHIWNETTFKAIGAACGGLIKIDEPTTEKAHLRWVRVLVKSGNGNSTLCSNCGASVVCVMCQFGWNQSQGYGFA